MTFRLRNPQYKFALAEAESQLLPKSLRFCTERGAMHSGTDDSIAPIMETYETAKVKLKTLR